MEIFEVLYKNQKVNAIKTNKGNIYVNLPTRYGERGSEFRESISRDSHGWRFSSFIVKQPEYNFSLWIRDDGRIAYRNKKSDKVFITKEVFEPNSKNEGKLNNIAMEVYKTVQQLKDYEKRDIPASSTCKLRRKKLEAILKLLEYPSADDLNGYFALVRIGKQLENYINLGTYVHYEGKNNQEDIIRVNIPNEMTRDDFIKLALPVTDEYSEDLDFIKEQDEKWEQKQSILPDYCAKMSTKIPYDDWLIYSRVAKETAKLLLELNADLLEQDGELEVTDFSQLTGKELADRISVLIDSRAFSKACEIENRFIIRESERLVRKIDSMLEEMNDSTYNSSIRIALDNLKKEETAIIKERKSKIQDTGMGIDD